MFKNSKNSLLENFGRVSRTGKVLVLVQSVFWMRLEPVCERLRRLNGSIVYFFNSLSGIYADTKRYLPVHPSLMMGLVN